MDEKIFLATLMLKKNIKNESQSVENIYEPLGPMLGTMEDDIFINNKDKEYNSILDIDKAFDNEKRYFYYNKISLKEAKEKYKTINLEDLVKLYYEEQKDKNFYVIFNKDSNDAFTIIYKADQVKKVYDSKVSKQII